MLDDSFRLLFRRMKYTHELVDTHGGALLPERAPEACSRSKMTQNPSCVSAFIPTDFEIVIRNFTRPF